MSTHKAQGQTMEKAIIDLANCHGTEALYVRWLDDLLILRPFPLAKIRYRMSDDIGSRKEFATTTSWPCWNMVPHRARKCWDCDCFDKTKPIRKKTERHSRDKLKHPQTSVIIDIPCWYPSDKEVKGASDDTSSLRTRWRSIGRPGAMIISKNGYPHFSFYSHALPHAFLCAISASSFLRFSFFLLLFTCDILSPSIYLQFLQRIRSDLFSCSTRCLTPNPPSISKDFPLVHRFVRPAFPLLS